MGLYVRRKKTLLAGVLLVMSIGCALPGVSVADDRKEKKNVVARVNDSYISQEDYKRQFSIAQQQLIRQGMALDEAENKRLSTEVLENLIDNQLLFQESRKRGYSADALTVEKRYQEVRDQFSNDEDFAAALGQMQYTEKSFKEAVERRLVLETLIENDIAAGITVSDEEALQYYEKNPAQFVQPKQIRARHILIIVKDQNDEQQKKEAFEKITMVQQKLKDGEDFAALAKEFSEGPSNEQGGDLGFFQPGQMVKPFEDAAFALEVGEVSDVVETRFGYHLIEVTDIRPEVSVPFEYAKGSIVQFMQQNLIMEKIEALVVTLKDGAVIERYPENM
jgi:peptidyl-prolyl cis-trans isomerase C